MNHEMIAERVRAAMAMRGLTQAELADLIGFDRPKMSKSLSGARRLTSLDLAKVAVDVAVEILPDRFDGLAWNDEE